jgi:hypothetical protein
MLQDRFAAVGVEETLAVQPTSSQRARPSGAEDQRLRAGNPSPSPIGSNGHNGEAAQPATPGDRGASAATTPPGASAAGRGTDGRFAKGNAGGTGNPFARQVAALRQAALAAITPDTIRAIFAKMADLALAGDVPAAKLVLAYAVGKPAAAPIRTGSTWTNGTISRTPRR